MQDSNYGSTISSSGKGPLIVSAVCLILNFLIGETILANVILIMVAFFTAISAFFSSLFAMFKSDRRNRPVGVLIGSLVILGIIIGLAVTDSIPAGYGP